MCDTSQSCLEPWALSHTHVRVKVKGAQVCATLTRLRKMCVRRSVLSSPPRRVHDIRQCLYAQSVKKTTNAQESCKVAAT